MSDLNKGFLVVGGVTTPLSRKKRPEITKTLKERDLQETVNHLVEHVQLLSGQNKDVLERAITYKDLIHSGFNLGALVDGGLSIIPPEPPVEPPDLTTPPLVTGIDVSATFNNVLMHWDKASYKNHAFVEVYRAYAWKDDAKTIPTNISDATFLASVPTTAYADKVIPLDEYRYWFRNVSTSEVRGEFSQMYFIKVPPRPSYLLEVISEEIRQSDLYKDLSDIVDLVTPTWEEVLTPVTGLSDLLKDPTNGLIAEFEALDLQVNNPISGLAATVSNLDAAVNDPITGLTAAVNSIDLQINAPSSGISAQLSSLNTTVYNPSTGLVSAVNSLGLQINGGGGIEARLNTLDGIVTNPSTGLVDVVSGLDLQINSGGGVAAQAQQALSLSQSNEGTIDASYTVKLDVGGVVAGFGLMNQSGVTSFGIRSDRFWIAPPVGSPYENSQFIPFIVDGDKVLIANAFIDQAFIESIVAGEITADYINALNLNAVSISGGTIDIGNYFSVNSTGYMEASSALIGGWTVNSSAIYTGNYQSSNAFSTSGITLHKDGALRAPKFRLDTNGDAYFKGDVTGASFNGLRFKIGSFPSTIDGDQTINVSTYEGRVYNVGTGSYSSYGTSPSFAKLVGVSLSHMGPSSTTADMNFPVINGSNTFVFNRDDKYDGTEYFSFIAWGL